MLAACGLASMPAGAVTTCSGANVAVAFGAYEAFSPVPLDAQGSLVVTCARDGGQGNMTISVAIGASQTSGSTANRQLAGPAPDRLNYNLYRDAARTSVWGETAGSDTVTQALVVPNKSSASATFTIFGRLFVAQDVRPGFYSDSLLITVNY